MDLALLYPNLAPLLNSLKKGGLTTGALTYGTRTELDIAVKILQADGNFKVSRMSDGKTLQYALMAYSSENFCLVECSDKEYLLDQKSYLGVGEKTLNALYEAVAAKHKFAVGRVYLYPHYLGADVYKAILEEAEFMLRFVRRIEE